MSNKIIKHCKVCGTEYETCYGCEKARSWRVHTDTLDHYYILTVLMEYQSGHDAKRAYRALRNRGVDFINTGSYLPNVQSLLAEIYAGFRGTRAKPAHEEKQEQTKEQETEMATEGTPVE